jgi:Mg2+ and Co2+ transporter CorA
MATQYGDHMAELCLVELTEQLDLITNPSEQVIEIKNLALATITKLRDFLNTTNENDLDKEENDNYWASLQDKIEDYISELKAHASKQQESHRNNPQPLHRECILPSR